MMKLGTLPLRAALAFVMSFGLAKATAFAAALALPRIVDVRTYGSLELAMSIGLMGATILALGAPGVALRFHLIEGDARAKTVLLLNGLIVAALSTLLALALVALERPVLHVICAAAVGMYAFQLSGSTYVRMHGRVLLSGWFDNIGVIILFLLATSLALFAHDRPAILAVELILVSCVVAASCLLMLLQERPTGLGRLIAQTALLGAPMMMYGFATSLITGTIRIAIARELGLREVAAYAVCARVALVLLFTSQVVQIGLLTKLYKLDNATIGRLFTGWIVGISAVAFATTAMAHLGAHWLVLGTEIGAAEAARLFPAVAVQTTLFALMAILEPYINRELLSPKASVCLVVIALATLLVGALCAAAGILTLRTMINLYSLAAAVTLVAQMWLLSSKGMNFRSSFVVLPITATPLLIPLLPQ